MSEIYKYLLKPGNPPLQIISVSGENCINTLGRLSMN